MHAIEFMESLKRLEISVFTVVDTAKILNKSREYVRLYLHRLEKQGLLIRIEKNKYALRDMDVWVVATSIVKPSYISFLSAFYLHHLTTQIPIRIQVVAPISRKTAFFKDHEIDFIKIKQNRIFGYRKHLFGGSQIYIAEKEKAIVDSLYLQKGVAASDVNNALSQCDIKKLISYAIRMESKVVIQRLGYLLELNKFEIPSSFLKMIGQNYVLLNPTLPKKGKRIPKWKLIVNEVLE